MDASLDEAGWAAVEAEIQAEKSALKTPIEKHVRLDGDKEGAPIDGHADTGSDARADGKEDGQQSQWAFSTWSWGEADRSMNLDPVANATAEDRVETSATNPMPSEERAVTATQGRPSIVDMAWMVLVEPVAATLTYTSGSSFGEDTADQSSVKNVRRRSLEVPATPPRGSGDTLLHVGEVEWQEGYLGWWRPCCLQLWPARLRAIALQESEQVVDAQGENGQVEASKEGDVLWEMILDPATSNASLVYDSCFEVVGGEKATFRCANAPDADEWVKHITLILNWVKEQIAARKWAFVYLNVYDLAGDWRVSAFNWMSQDRLGMGGMFHAGLEVYGKEYMFGGGGDEGDILELAPYEEDIYTLTSAEESGVSSCHPRSCDRHRFREALCLGLTTLSEKEVRDTLCVLARDWPSRCYRTLERNCIHFCKDFSEQLGVTAVPDWVNYLAGEASKRRIIQQAPPTDTSDDTAASPRKVMCFWKHPCVLQAQSWMAGLVEMLVCESCCRELEGGEAFWHCHECDFDMCAQCGEETLARNSESAFGLVNA